MSSELDADIASVHALFQSFDGMEGLTSVTIASPVHTHLTGWRSFFCRIYPGLLVAATIALAATWLSQHYRSPVMLFALLFGMTFHFLYEEGRCVAGIEFSSKVVLRVGVALLGARITASQILELGVMPIATVVVGIVSTIVLGAFAAQSIVWRAIRRCCQYLWRLGGPRYRFGVAPLA